MKTAIFSTIALVMIGTLLIGVQTAISDDDERFKDIGRWERAKMRSTGIAPFSNPAYQEECGSCHMAYPPGLLPSASWRKIMEGLDDHFGDNAELDEEVSLQITAFLVANSADRSNYRRSRAFMYGGGYPGAMIPIRITDLPYFRHEHNEIPRWIVELPEVGSLAQCNACHRYAESSSFNEHDVYIKGVGRWDD